jgi:hypothetical protein
MFSDANDLLRNKAAVNRAHSRRFATFPQGSDLWTLTRSVKAKQRGHLPRHFCFRKNYFRRWRLTLSWVVAWTSAA